MTLTRKDVHTKNGVVRLRFFGEAGKRIQRTVEDAALGKALTALKAQPGDMLFTWTDKDGQNRCLGADRVNAALPRLNCGGGAAGC